MISGLFDNDIGPRKYDVSSIHHCTLPANSRIFTTEILLPMQHSSNLRTFSQPASKNTKKIPTVRSPPPTKVRTCQSQSAYRGFASTLVCPANVFLYPPLWATKYWGAWTRTLWLASWQGCLCLAAGLRCTLPLLVQALPQPRRNLPGEATGRKRLCLTIYTTRHIGSQLEAAAIYDQGRELVGTVSTCVPSTKASSLS